MSEYYGVASTPTEDFIAHYGIKGMKWGVRKAIQSGNDRALRRQYKKASKKLAKLEKLGASGKKYGKRAALYGAGAAAAGGLAAAGTGGVSSAMAKLGAHGGNAMVRGGKGISRAGTAVSNALYNAGVATGSSALKKIGAHGGQAMIKAGKAISKAGSGVSSGLYGASQAVGKWGRSTSISDNARASLEKNFRGMANGPVRSAASNTSSALKGVSNNTIARIGAGAIGAGLGIAAGRNAYRAATAKKHAAQAQQFRAEMNKAFAGTKYANGMPAKRKKSRRG